MIYTAKMGDTWDLISLKIYGSEKFVIPLMVANPSYSDVVIFDGGEQLILPELPNAQPVSLPPWRR